MSLEIKKFYVDTRFKTSDSRSDTDFTVELPRSFNIPEKTVAYIDDIVIPVAWLTVDGRNSRLHFALVSDFVVTQRSLEMTHENYTGTTFATELQARFNEQLVGLDAEVRVNYDFTKNEIELSMVDNRPIASGIFNIILLSYEDLKTGHFFTTPINDKLTLNGVLRLTKSRSFAPTQPYKSTLDLHTTRNLYLISSALGCYNTVSNFGNDTIIKKIPVKAQYNEMLFHDSGAGFDYIDLSKRTLRNIDFKLVDSFFNTVDMRGNHWSFSVIFEVKG